MTARADHPRFRLFTHPVAAPAVWPYPGHRSMAEVMAAEDAERRRAQRLAAPVFELHDYGSPFAAGRTRRDP